MSLDIILSQPEITVLGPPASVNLQLDIGPQGIRGNKVFSGVGDPASNPTVTDAIAGDLYLRTDPSGAGYLYQYLSSITGTLQWVVVFQLDPVIYNARESVTFSAGEGTLVIPIYYILGSFSQTINLSSLQVVFSPEYDKPVAISLSNKQKVNSDVDLELTFIGKEYNEGLSEWVDIDNAVTINASISAVTITTDLVPPSS
jgi:hypothetical protein